MKTQSTQTFDEARATSYSDLLTQRDELLAALVRAENALFQFATMDQIGSGLRDQMRSAVAHALDAKVAAMKPTRPAFALSSKELAALPPL